MPLIYIYIPALTLSWLSTRKCGGIYLVLWAQTSPHSEIHFRLREKLNFLVGSCFSIFNFSVVICRSLFVLLSFLFWSFYCLSFFDLWLLITSLWYLHAFLRTIYTPVRDNSPKRFHKLCIKTDKSIT